MTIGKLLGKLFTIAFVGGISLGMTAVMHNAHAPRSVVWAFAILAIILIVSTIIEVWRKL